MAVTLTVEQLQNALGRYPSLGPSAPEDDDAARMLAAASAIIEKYASGAPESVQDEALVRLCGWLWDQPAAGRNWTQLGPHLHRYTTTMRGAMRHSGAAGLLNPWKRRRIL